MSSLLVVGSVAFDTIHNHLGSHDRVIGGSATYASLAASQLADVRLVGVVGQDFPREAVEMLRSRGIDTSGLEVAIGETFHWEGRYSDDLTSRETIQTDLNVFADFNPKIPASFQDSEFVMLGNIAPQLQLHVLDQVQRPKLVIADTMNLWIDTALDALKELLTRIDILVINEEEARQLTGYHHPLAVAEALRAMGPETVIVKRGEYGALLFLEEDIFWTRSLEASSATLPRTGTPTYVRLSSVAPRQHRSAFRTWASGHLPSSPASTSRSESETSESSPASKSLGPPFS
jgi:sugar/nucleoside kinase (ribokinase family)